MSIKKFLAVISTFLASTSIAAPIPQPDKNNLLWNTDLDQAKYVSAKEAKPILSLRLLGNFTEELSCANSRVFKTLLYPDPAIQKLLREKFILHWSSERAVPKVTIDFGDGRKIKTTVTGNSIHYILNENGQVLDALPGVYAPRVFESKLQKIIFAYSKNKTAVDHKTTITAIQQELGQALPIIENYFGLSLNNLQPDRLAANASNLALTKAVMQTNTLKSLGLADSRQSTINDFRAELLPLVGSVDVNLSPETTALITKMHAGNPEDLAAQIEYLKQSLKIDTFLNQFLRARIHSWLQNGQPSDLSSLNERVYKELFLTPKDDQWLGLYNPRIFTGLSNGGIIK
ncbi:hypothetical protein JNK13_09120 [bacterium]|nr:hypothetical protein [bacterium]